MGGKVEKQNGREEKVRMDKFNIQSIILTKEKQEFSKKSRRKSEEESMGEGKGKRPTLW